MRIAYLFEVGDETTIAMHLHPTWDEAVDAAADRERGARD